MTTKQNAGDGRRNSFDAFRAMHDELFKNHPEQFALFHDGELVVVFPTDTRRDATPTNISRMAGDCWRNSPTGRWSSPASTWRPSRTAPKRWPPVAKVDCEVSSGEVFVPVGVFKEELSAADAANPPAINRHTTLVDTDWLAR